MEPLNVTQGSVSCQKNADKRPTLDTPPIKMGAIDHNSSNLTYFYTPECI